MSPVDKLNVDPNLSSPFRVDWLAEMSRNEREDVERAVADKAAVALRAAKFTRTLYRREGAETEVKVWLETGISPAYLAVHFEPRLMKHYFLVMDAQGRERLAAVVFEKSPSVTGAECEAETRLFMDTFRGIMHGRQEMEMMEFVDALQTEYKAMPKRK